MKAGLLIAATVLLPTCGGGPSAGVPVANKTVETVPQKPEIDAGLAPPTPLASARATLQYLPNDIDTVAHFQWRKIRAGTLRGQEILSKLEAEFLPIRDKCGLNVPELVDTVTIGISGKENPEESFIAAVTGDLRQSQVETCLLSLGTPLEAGRFTLDGNELNLFWPTEEVLLVSRKVSAADMQARLGSGNLLERQELMPWIRRTDSHADVWAAAAGAGALFEGLRSLGGIPEGLYLNVVIEDAISIFVSVQFPQAQQARQMESFVRQIDEAQRPSDGDELRIDSMHAQREDRRLDVLIKLIVPTLASP